MNNISSLFSTLNQTYEFNEVGLPYTIDSDECNMDLQRSHKFFNSDISAKQILNYSDQFKNGRKVPISTVEHQQIPHSQSVMKSDSFESFKMSDGMIYEIENLESAREFLSETTTKVVLSNPEGSTRYYGMRVIDYIFTRLQIEFPNKIKGVIVNAFDDYSAFVTAKELGYKNINYIG